MEHKKGSLKSTIAVSLTNYLDAGAIVAGASGLTLWQNYLGLNEGHLGWLNAISANAFGAAIGAIFGGFLADKYGRKTISNAVDRISDYRYFSGSRCSSLMDIYFRKFRSG